MAAPVAPEVPKDTRSDIPRQGSPQAATGRQPWPMTDNLTPEQRSMCMARVRNRDTSLERVLRSAIHRRGLRFRKHVRSLPGTPDIVFVTAKVAVFIDGDFWHGWRFPLWKATASPFWREKICRNRDRDRRNQRKLRAAGWRVLRIWQHNIEKGLSKCVSRIELLLATPSARGCNGHRF